MKKKSTYNFCHNGFWNLKGPNYSLEIYCIWRVANGLIFILLVFKDWKIRLVRYQCINSYWDWIFYQLQKNIIFFVEHSVSLKLSRLWQRFILYNLFLDKIIRGITFLIFRKYLKVTPCNCNINTESFSKIFI